MKPDFKLSSDNLRLGDLCTLLGLDVDQYTGFVAVLVPATWAGRDAQPTPPVIVSDAPNPAAILTVLGYVIQDLSQRIQHSDELDWQ